MKNNNKAIIKKITRRALSANKKRNFFILSAIALTAFMLTSVFSVGVSFYESVALFPFRLEGTRTHMGIDSPDEEQLATLKELDYVRHISHTERLGMAYIPAFENGMLIIYACETNWNEFLTPTYTNLRGRFATAENEIMMSRAKLSAMGIDDPYLGMEIPLSFSIFNAHEIIYETFILSAIYTEFVSAQPGVVFTPIFVSHAFAMRHGTGDYTSVNIIFTNTTRARDYALRLLEELPLRHDQEYGLHPALFGGMGLDTEVMYITIAIIVAFLMFTGFLLIYNVMYASVSNDVQFYGMLKTLGTTPRQLRRIVNGQVFYLCLIGLPVGAVVAAVASLVIVPAFFVSGGIPTGAVVSFSPIIYLFGIVFSFLTAYIGALTPARKAAAVSPVESVKYIGEQHIKPRQLGRGGKPWRMAWRNVFRERKRVRIVLLSLFLGITVFGVIMSIVSSMDIDNEIATWYDHDFAVSGAIGFIDGDFISRVAAIPDVTEIHQITQSFAVYRAEMSSSAVFGIDTDWLIAIDPTFAYTLDIEAFERGEIALAHSTFLAFDANPLYLPVGYTLTVEIGSAEQLSEITIAGEIHRVWPLTGFGVGMGTGLRRMPDLVMSSAYLQQHHGMNDITHIGINVRPDTDAQVNTALEAMMVHGASAMNSRYEARRAIENERMVMAVFGSGISAILALIGILNFVNTLSVGLIVRKREFATLESVGMTKAQLRKLLRSEGAIYCIIVLALSLTLGTGIAFGLLHFLISNPSITMFTHFVYPIVPIIIAYIAIIIICTITPEIAYKNISKGSLVDRLRD